MNRPSDHRPSIKPRRAEPIQPDAPGRGTDAGTTPQEEDATGGTGPSTMESSQARRRQSKATAKRQAEQSRTSLDNVRDGYE